MNREAPACVLLALLLAACGGRTSEGSGSNDSGADSGLSGHDAGLSAPDSASNDSGLAVLPPCPADAPAQGSACPAAGLECQYGTNVFAGCVQIADCTTSGWDLTGPASDCSSTSCPPSYAPLADASPVEACAPALQVTDCWYPQGVCQCSAGLGGPAAPLGWYCVPVSPGCPYPTPASGSPCTQPRQQCGGSCGGAGVECDDGGTWQVDDSPCPV